MWTQTASMSVCVSVYVRAHPLYIQYVLYHICGELLSNVYDGNTRSKSFVAGHECIRLNRTGLNTGSGFFFLLCSGRQWHTIAMSNHPYHSPSTHKQDLLSGTGDQCFKSASSICHFPWDTSFYHTYLMPGGNQNWFSVKIRNIWLNSRSDLSLRVNPTRPQPGKRWDTDCDHVEQIVLNSWKSHIHPFFHPKPLHGGIF